MGKRYKNLRIEAEVLVELKKIKNLYQLQDSEDYSNSDIILKLIERCKNKQFILPDINIAKN